MKRNLLGYTAALLLLLPQVASADSIDDALGPRPATQPTTQPTTQPATRPDHNKTAPADVLIGAKNVYRGIPREFVPWRGQTWDGTHLLEANKWFAANRVGRSVEIIMPFTGSTPITKGGEIVGLRLRQEFNHVSLFSGVTIDVVLVEIIARPDQEKDLLKLRHGRMIKTLGKIKSVQIAADTHDLQRRIVMSIEIVDASLIH